ncbi:MAG: hypothetical protein QOD99_274 [Chthoniobacter sp.]|jgi:sulfite exporter TauE/SafE|nr:hypothetical protein [Chthoniobacter sp.]
MAVLFFTGFLAGAIHVFSGPDHLAAIAPLSVKHPHRSWVAGFRWGAGHSAGVLVVGALSLLLREVLPIDLLSRSGDRLVGLLLIAIGAWSLRKALQIHSHDHFHHGERHEHLHLHGRAARHAERHVHMHAAFGIGTLHGIAGSSHLLGVLPALALPSNALALSYLGAFAVGTVLAMIGFSSVLGAVASRFQMQAWKAYRVLMFGCSGLALIVGAAWLTGFSW